MVWTSIGKGKGKVYDTPQQSVGGCSSHYPRPWACRYHGVVVCMSVILHCLNTRLGENVDSVTPILFQERNAGPTVTFPAARHHRPLAGTKLYCLVTEARVLKTCPGLHSTAGRPGFKLATCWSQVQHPNHSATEPSVDRVTKKLGTWALRGRPYRNTPLSQRSCSTLSPVSSGMGDCYRAGKLFHYVTSHPG